jgi:hypothetical protein
MLFPHYAKDEYPDEPILHAFRAHIHTSQSHIGHGHKIADDPALGMHNPTGMFWAESHASRCLMPCNIAASETRAMQECVKSSIYLDMQLTEMSFPHRHGGGQPGDCRRDLGPLLQVQVHA